MRPAPYPVQASKLETRFHSEPNCTQHVKFVSDDALNRRRVRKEEKWSRVRELGRGTYGIVWLEQCIQGDDKGSLRAVKQVQKLKSNEYYEELEATALFSLPKYADCFVKSLGWYDDPDSIFIAMEYLPNGDLEKYLGSPLPEEEARDIVHQVLEGLQFMHENDFTHRDLKPANILVKFKGPRWWVKIADFGISKHVIEEHTALRTRIGTPSFAAPEVLGFFRPGDRLKESYTNAVDIWSLGVITFLILSAETPFKDVRFLNQYVMGHKSLPLDVLRSNEVSAQGCNFVQSLMIPNSENRPSAKDCLQQSWLRETTDVSREFNVINLSLHDHFEPEPSANWNTANWSTQNQVTAHEPNKPINVFSKNTSSLPSEVAISSNPTSDETLASSMSLRVHTRPQSSTDESLQDHIPIDEPYMDGMFVENAGFTSKTIVTPSKPRYNETVTQLTPSSDKVLKPATPTSHEIVDPGSAVQTSWKVVGSVNCDSQRIWEVKFSSDETFILTASDNDTIGLWDSATRRKCKRIKNHKYECCSLTLSPDGTLLASASHDRTLMLWDMATMNLRHIFEDLSFSVFTMTFSSDGTLLASALYDYTVKLWDMATMTIRHTLIGHSDLVRGVAFSSDGTLLATASLNRKVKLWDMATMTIRHTFEGHLDMIVAVKFMPDGTLLASASCDGVVKLWDMATMTIRHTLKGLAHNITELAHNITDVIFSSDGKYLASASWGIVRLWDPITGLMLQELRGGLRQVCAFAFSPKADLLVCGDDDGNLIYCRLVQIKTQKRPEVEHLPKTFAIGKSSPNLQKELPRKPALGERKSQKNNESTAGSRNYAYPSPFAPKYGKGKAGEETLTLSSIGEQLSSSFFPSSSPFILSPFIPPFSTRSNDEKMPEKKQSEEQRRKQRKK